MSVVILARSGDGGRRRCDANCHNAKGEECNCVCEGRNHGLGLKVALDKTDDRFIECLRLAYPEWKFERPQYQRELFDNTEGSHTTGHPSEAAPAPVE